MTHYDTFEDIVLTKLDAILARLDEILTKETAMSVEMDTLQAAVTDIQGAADSTITLVQGLADYIRAHANDPAAMLQMAADLEAKKDAMAAAVAANPVPTDTPA